MFVFKHLPNFLTLLNLVCGFIAIIHSFNIQTLAYAPYFIFLAAVFDFADGLAARVLHAYSDLGKQLDSLSDMVSFGLAPGIFIFQLLQFVEFANIFEGYYIYSLLISVLVPVFSAIRLGKFNIDERQNTYFIGMPTPASAIFIASLVWFVMNYPNWHLTQLILNIYVLSFIAVINSALMVSPIPMFSLKMKNLSLSDNLFQYIFMLGIIIAFVFFSIKTIPFIIPFYVLLSVIQLVSKKISSISEI